MTTANKVVLALAGVFGIVWFAVPREQTLVNPALARDPVVVRAPLAGANAPQHRVAGVVEPTAARDEIDTTPAAPVAAIEPAAFNYFDLITNVPSGRIEGIVLRETEPVDGGYVAFWPGHWRPLPPSGTEVSTTDEAPETVQIRRNGRFVIPELAEGWYSLAVDVGSGVSAQVNARVHHNASSLVIVLGNARIEGTVYDEDGARVAGAAIAIHHDAWDGSAASTHYTRTGREGTYRVADLPAGPCWVTVDLEGGFGAGANRESMRKLEPLAVGEVRVVDHGSPIGTTRWTGRLLTRSGAAVPGPGALGVSNDANDAYNEGAMAADGSFELRLTPGTYTVWSKRGERNVDLGTNVIGAADFVRDLELPGTTILGRARYEGAPRSDLLVSLHYSDGRPGHHAEVQPDGVFRFDGVTAGQWTVRAHPLRIQRGEPTVTLLDNDVELPLEVQLERP